MSLINSYICPECGNHFPLFLKPSIIVRRGFFSRPDLKCQNCGQICRPRTDVSSALIAWPITAVYIGLLFYALRTGVFKELYRAVWWLYVLFIILFLLAPLFLSIRRGFKLIKAQNDRKAEKSRLRKSLPIIGTALFLALFGYYSKDWSNVIIGVVVGVAVYFVYNQFRQKT